MRELIIKNMLLPLIDFSKSQMVSSYFKQYYKLHNKSREDVLDFQNRKIRQLISHAYENTVYYRQLFDNIGLQPKDIQTKEDLIKIPPLTREIIQTRFDDLRDQKNKYRSVSKGSSSGSTGQAVFYLHDEYGSSAGIAAHYLGWHLAGYRFGHKGLHIWGNPAIVKKVWNKRSSKIKSWFFRHYKFPAYKLTEEGKFNELIDILLKEKFEFIDGYTNAIYLLAVHLEKSNLHLEGIKYVLTTAENLHDHQRTLIEKRIGPVFDEFGCGEIMGIAYQNKHQNGYTIIDPHVAVEFDLDSKADDGSYPLMITDLDNKVMPLIRYMNGDLGVPGESDENPVLPFSTMKSVSGRSSDIIKLPEGGSLVVPSFFGSVLLKEVSSIKQYQIEKVSENKLVVKFVINSEFTKKDQQTIKNALDEYLGGQLLYEIKIVDHIQVNPNGKFKLLLDKTKSQ